MNDNNMNDMNDMNDMDDMEIYDSNNSSCDDNADHNESVKSSIDTKLSQRRRCLSTIRKNPGINPSTVLTNGQFAGEFALNYVFQNHDRRVNNYNPHQEKKKKNFKIKNKQK